MLAFFVPGSFFVCPPDMAWEKLEITPLLFWSVIYLPVLPVSLFFSAPVERKKGPGVWSLSSGLNHASSLPSFGKIGKKEKGKGK